MTKRSIFAITCALLPVIVTSVTQAKPAAAAMTLSDAGKKALSKYDAEFSALRKTLEGGLPKVEASILSSYNSAREAAKKAEEDANAAAAELGKINSAEGLIGHAKTKWIASAEKGIATTNAKLKEAKTSDERAAAKAELEKWKKNKAEGEAALVERQATYDSLVKNQAKLTQALTKAKDVFEKAKTLEAAASAKLVTATGAAISSDKMDAMLVKAAIMAEATPAGLAAFAGQGEKHQALLDKLFANPTLMQEMLEAGGAKFGKYGRAMEILQAIDSMTAGMNRGGDTMLRLALAVGLEHASPVEQTNALDQTNAPKVVDPLKRYAAFEKAFLAGELDPAFKDLNTWEMRMVVNCEAPDEIAAWGRKMLRTYRPDHISNGDYGWRYASAVKTDVSYGSQNVSKDLPNLHKFQNIPLNGGVCGRRAFFGRFALRCFGIPTWGVTQKAHAALSHWTPNGWVVNFGAGFDHSWWDKYEAPRSGSDFLLETQARAHDKEYVKVLRARWISRTLGEKQYNHRSKVEGGFWSQLALNQTVALASTVATLEPLGKELGEANEAKEKQLAQSSKVEAGNQVITTGADGSLLVPAVAHSKPSGSFAAVASFGGGMQLHITAGYKAKYEIEAPKAGKYALAVKLATLQNVHSFTAAVNSDAPSSITVPHTVGLWQKSPALEVKLAAGKNTIEFALEKDSKGITVKEFSLTPLP